MFERYSERARRLIFLARYEASQFGSMTIESEHLLLGLIRENGHLIQRFVPGTTPNTIRGEITTHLVVREKVSTSIDLPVSHECKRLLAYSAEEAERLNARLIKSEHILLGILREETCLAADCLNQFVFRVNSLLQDLD